MPPRTDPEPIRVGFVCVRNAGRSQIAAAIAETRLQSQGRDDIEVISGGTHPAQEIHPVVVDVMAENGIDLSDRMPREITTEELRTCDYVATMGCSTLDVSDAESAVDLREWPLDDPAGEAPERVREIRDDIEQRVTALFEEIGEGINDPDPTDPMETAMKLKRAEKDDFEYVERLLDENGLPTADVRADGVELFIGWADSIRVGIGGLEIHGANALLRSVVIQDSMQGHGYGSTLCEQLLERARQHDVESVYLLTTTAADFFESIGFQTIDRTHAPAAIRDTREFDALCPASAVCLRKTLTGSDRDW